MLALTADPGLALAERDVPKPGPGEALIRLRMAGICNTDLEIVRGYMGFRGVLGHEALGDVVECDDASWIGKRVVCEINLSCGSCATCAEGLGRHCPTRTVLGILGKDGCFAEYMTAPVRNLIEVPAEVEDERAVLTEPLAAAFEILEQVEVKGGHRVAVLGDGKLGLLSTLVLLGTSAEVHLVGKHPSKMAIAGARGAHLHRHDEEIPGKFDVVVEATGSPEGLARAIALTRPRGTVVLKSTFHGATPVVMAPLVIDELTLVGSRCGLFPPALTAHASRRIDVSPLISARYSLRDGLAAFTEASRSGVLKVLLDMRGHDPRVSTVARTRALSHS
ncbi:MAG: alcohol dehydrogenase catalytic domain-containing protein [Vicinamibacteria bacterium]